MSTLVRPARSVEVIPPLEQGDHLSREEFERRYEAMSHVKKAELIEGVVYMPSPVSYEGHGKSDADLAGWLWSYHVHTPGTGQANNTTIRLDLDNEPQPDSLLMIEPSSGGSVEIEDGYIVSAPELVAEVASSSVSIDLNTKLHVYRRNGVREYIVWRVRDQAVDWFVLRGSQYERLTPTTDGLLKSECFPGLWLDPAALLRGDMLRVLEVLTRGLGSAEHGEFVEGLAERRKLSS
jgi:Uma2 family endonuclease